MEVQKTTVNTNEGEITKAAKAIGPIWTLVIALAGFVGVVYAGSEAWIKIKDNQSGLNTLREQVTRQYTTHNTEMAQMRKDYDKEIDDLLKDSNHEMDILEAEIDKLKEQVQWHLAYEQALKDLKK